MGILLNTRLLTLTEIISKSYILINLRLIVFRCYPCLKQILYDASTVGLLQSFYSFPCIRRYPKYFYSFK